MGSHGGRPDKLDFAPSVRKGPAPASVEWMFFLVGYDEPEVQCNGKRRVSLLVILFANV